MTTVRIFLPFAAPILLALVVSVVAYPFYERLNGWVGEARRGLAAAITCLLLVLLVFLPLAWIGYSMVRQAVGSVESIVARFEKAKVWVEDKEWYQELRDHELFQRFWRSLELDRTTPEAAPDAEGSTAGEASAGDAAAGEDVAAAAAGKAAAGEAGHGDVRLESLRKSFPLAVSLIRWLSASAASFVGNAFSVILQLILMLLILFFFFKDGPELLRSLNRAIPVDESYKRRVADTFRNVSRSVIRGSLLTALVQGAVAAIAFLIIGVPAAFWGVMTAFCALIPPFGTSLILVPLTVAYFADGRTWQGGALAAVVVVVGALDNILRPVFVGSGLRMHPVWLVLSILGAMQLFGPSGLLFGPMVLVLLGTFIRLLVQEEGLAPAGAAGGEGGQAVPSTTGRLS